MRTAFNKHKFLRIIKVYKDKHTTVTYVNREKAPKDVIINPNHIFLGNGYTTIFVKDGCAETINPLDFESKFDGDNFKTAIDSHIIRETFAGLKTKMFDLTQVLIGASLILNIIIIYFLMKQMGVF